MFGREKNKLYSDDSKTVVSTLIGKETVFDGDLTSGEALRIDGVVNGNCKCEKKLILSPDGKIKGNFGAECYYLRGSRWRHYCDREIRAAFVRKDCRRYCGRFPCD